MIAPLSGPRCSLRLAVAPAWPAEPVGVAPPAARRMRAKDSVVRHSRIAPPMTGSGQTEKSRQRDGTAGLPSTADMFDDCRYGCWVPQTDAHSLFDHLVSTEKRERGDDAERFGGLEVDQQFDFRDLLHRLIGRLVAFEDTSDIDTGLTVRFHETACS
jgi:hypothetical protein